jgi:hypothetical protein
MTIERAIDRYDQFLAVAGVCTLTGVCGYAIERMSSLIYLFAGGVLEHRYTWDLGALLAIPALFLVALGVIAGAIALSEHLLPVRWARAAVLALSVLVTAFCYPHSG